MTEDPEVQRSSISRRRALAPWSIDAGAPEHLVLHLLVQGSFLLSRADGQVLDVAAGDLLGIVSSANDAFGMRLEYASGIEPGEVISASYRMEETWPAGLPPVIHLRERETRREQGLTSIVGLLRAELSSGSREQERVARTLLDPLLAYTLRCWRAARTGERGFQSPRPLDARLARVLALLQAEPARAWTVEALGRAAGMSRAAFARRFLAALGVPPLRYLAEVRMQRASRILVEGDDSLASVAVQIGYESEFAFSRAFKRFHGEAPGAFRRRMRACPGASMRAPIRAVA